MIASSLSESKVTITPTSRISQADNVQKRDNPGTGNNSKKSEATLIATKNAPSAKTEATEMAKFLQSLANVTGQQSQQQPAAGKSSNSFYV